MLPHKGVCNITVTQIADHKQVRLQISDDDDDGDDDDDDGGGGDDDHHHPNQYNAS